MGKFEDAYRSALGDYQVALTQEEHAYRNAEARGDVDGMATAHQNLSAIRAQLREFNQLAQEEQARRHREMDPEKFREQQLRAARNSLTPEEIETAVNSHSHGTKEQRIDS